MCQLKPSRDEFGGTGDYRDAEVIRLYGEAAQPAVPRRMRRAGCLLMMCGLVLLPWLYVLATSLPATATASHWPVAWVGLDALEAAGLIATGVLAALDDRRHALTAAATATLLVVDAWFDTTTAAAGRDLATAVAMAVCVELPLAVLCAALAVRALRRAE
jgi:hypothetical protein